MTPTAASPVVPWATRLPWVLFAVSAALVIVSVPLSLGQEPLSDTLLYGMIAIAGQEVPTSLFALGTILFRPARLRIQYAILRATVQRANGSLWLRIQEVDR